MHFRRGQAFRFPPRQAALYRFGDRNRLGAGERNRRVDADAAVG